MCLKLSYNTEAILGNGKFDNESKQKTGNCWVHAGINAINIPS